MTDISANFRTFLLADSSITAKVSDRIFAIKVPQNKGLPIGPFIWFRKRQALSHDTLDGPAGESPFDFYFDIECVAKNNEVLALQVAELVRTRCNNYRGSVGDSTALGIFVNDQDDDYEAQSTGGDDSFCYGALDVRVVVQV
jgi:hypothetical protein